MTAKGKKSDEKQYKIILRSDRDIALYKWAQTLPYGAFPRVILEVLNWMDLKGLLVRGGMVAPDILFENLKDPALMPVDDKRIENEILLKLLEIEKLLKEGDFKINDQRLGLIDSLNQQTEQSQHGEDKQEIESESILTPEYSIQEVEEVSSTPTFQVYKYTNE